MKRLLAACAAVFLLATPAMAVTVYNVNYTAGTDSFYNFGTQTHGSGSITVTGTITTNGANNRFLTNGDITAFTLNFAQGAYTRTVTGTSNNVYFGGSHIYASNGSIRIIGYRSGSFNIGNNGHYLQSSTSGTPFVTLNAQPSTTTGWSASNFISGQIATIAQVPPPPPPPTPTPVPIPAGGALLLTGLLGLGLAMRKVKRETRQSLPA